MSKKICPFCGAEFIDVTNANGHEVCQFCETDLSTGLPPNPEIDGNTKISAYLGALLFFASIVIFIVSIAKDPVSLFGLLAALALVVFAYTLCKGIFHYNGKKKKYALAQSDKDAYIDFCKKEYAKMVSTRNEYMELSAKYEETKRLKKEQSVPACPICHSKQHVRRLSSLDRTVSTAVWGVASSAIGKQWECASCNHMFNVDAVAPSTDEGKPTDTTMPDPTDELRKYKQLLDDGVITQDDFDQKKKQLLRL